MKCIIFFLSKAEKGEEGRGDKGGEESKRKGKERKEEKGEEGREWQERGGERKGREENLRNCAAGHFSTMDRTTGNQRVQCFHVVCFNATKDSIRKVKQPSGAKDPKENKNRIDCLQEY